MIFQHTCDLVISGQKTQTRRIKKSDKPPCRVGQSIAVQPGRGKRAVCRVVVTEVREERLGDITEDDAKAEGRSSRAEYVELWQEIHGGFDPKTLVWVVEFLPP